MALAILTAMLLQAVSAPPPPRDGELVARDGIKLRYRTYGAGPRAVLVPLGFILEPDFKRLARADRTLVFYDQRNRGRSETAPAARSTLGDEVADMESLRRQLGFESVTTIGYSYLGMMTVMYAMEHPERVERLVQLGPVPRRFGTTYPPAETASDPEPVVSKEQEAELERLEKAGMKEKDPRAFCERSWQVYRARLVGDPRRVAALGPGHCDLPNEWPLHLERHWLEVRMPEVQRLDLPVERLRAVRSPVLTIHGTRDRNAPYGAGREWARALPDARLLTVAGAAHQSWVEQPELVFGAIEEFLQGRWPREAERLGPER